MAKWDRDDTIIALEAYRNNATSAQIEKVAKIIGKTPDSVRMKFGNFIHLDPKAEGNGFDHPSQLDVDVWNEYSRDWSKLKHDAQQAEDRKLHTVQGQNESFVDKVVNSFFK